MKDVLAILCSCTVLTISLSVISGYAVKLPRLYWWTGAGPGMAIETATCFLLLSLSIILLHTSRKWWK